MSLVRASIGHPRSPVCRAPPTSRRTFPTHSPSTRRSWPSDELVPFARKYINLNLLFSRATDMSVLSFASDDDDGLDLACLSFAGQLHRLRFKADALEIIWTEGHGVIQPLVRDDDHAASEAELLVLKSLSEFKILAPEERSSVLHRNCTRRVQSVSPYRNVHSGDGHLGRVRPYRSRLHAR